MFFANRLVQFLLVDGQCSNDNAKLSIVETRFKAGEEKFKVKIGGGDSNMCDSKLRCRTQFPAGQAGAVVSSSETKDVCNGSRVKRQYIRKREHHHI